MKGAEQYPGLAPEWRQYRVRIFICIQESITCPSPLILYLASLQHKMMGMLKFWSTVSPSWARREPCSRLGHWWTVLCRKSCKSLRGGSLSFFWELFYSWSSCSWSPPELHFSCFAALSVLYLVPLWYLLWFWASDHWPSGFTSDLSHHHGSAGWMLACVWCWLLLQACSAPLAQAKRDSPGWCQYRLSLRISAPSSTPAERWTLRSAWQAVSLAEIFSLSLIPYLLFQMQQIISRCLEVLIWVELPS